MNHLYYFEFGIKIRLFRELKPIVICAVKTEISEWTEYWK